MFWNIIQPKNVFCLANDCVSPIGKKPRWLYDGKTFKAYLKVPLSVPQSQHTPEGKNRHLRFANNSHLTCARVIDLCLLKTEGDTHDLYPSHSTGEYTQVLQKSQFRYFGPSFSDFLRGTHVTLGLLHHSDGYPMKTHSNIFPNEESLSLCLLLRDKKKSWENVFSCAWNYWQNKTAQGTELPFLRACLLPLFCWQSWISIKKHFLQYCSKMMLFTTPVFVSLCQDSPPKASNLETTLALSWFQQG